MAGVLILLLCIFVVFNDGVHGHILSSTQEDIELEKQLKLLNKAAVKTIQTDYGHLYDCVDFYKQPAFDHPLLKNHAYTYEMKPKFMNRIKNDTVSNGGKSSRVKLADGGCPIGTVPIRRITKEDLLREKLVAGRLDTGNTYYAVVQTKPSDSNQFTGAEGFISLYNPQTQEQQYSQARIKIQNGEYGNEFIQSGWRVDPTLYGDNRTHLFIQTRTPSAMCLDVRCGFVVKANDSSPGLAYPDVSIRGQTTFETKHVINRDFDGNWWLLIGESDNNEVGFWPHELFKELADFGPFVDWGGEVYTPSGIPEPPMGSSYKPVEKTQYDAFVRRIGVFDNAGNFMDPETVEFSTSSLQYQVIDVKQTNDFFRHLVLFGGCNVNESC